MPALSLQASPSTFPGPPALAIWSVEAGRECQAEGLRKVPCDGPAAPLPSPESGSDHAGLVP